MYHIEILILGCTEKEGVLGSGQCETGSNTVDSKFEPLAIAKPACTSLPEPLSFAEPACASLPSCSSESDAELTCFDIGLYAGPEVEQKRRDMSDAIKVNLLERH